jgi:hypothetical protein
MAPLTDVNGNEISLKVRINILAFLRVISPGFTQAYMLLA